MNGGRQSRWGLFTIPTAVLGDAGIACHAVGQPIPSIRYTGRLGEAGIEPSVGSVGDSYEFKQIRAADQMIWGII